jgi:hypothetical protein
LVEKPTYTLFAFTQTNLHHLLLQVVGAEREPTGGAFLTPTTFIQRLNTSGGVASSTGCSLSTNVGATALVPYTADYFFYKVSWSD